MSAADFWALMARFKIQTVPELIWFSVGMLGQAMFFGRFFVQWIA